MINILPYTSILMLVFALIAGVVKKLVKKESTDLLDSNLELDEAIYSAVAVAIVLVIFFVIQKMMGY